MTQPSPPDNSTLDRHTFYVGMANGIFVFLANACLDPETVLPAFALQVMPGGSVLRVGIICSAINLGWFWPQIFLSRQMETKPLLLPYYGLAQGLRAVCMTLICIALYLFAVENPGLTFAIVVLLLFASSSGGAYSMIPFMRIFRDGLPPRWLGAFLGWRYALGGLTAFAVGFWIKSILSSETGPTYPVNYILVFGGGGISAAVCGLLFMMIKERPHKIAKHTLPMRYHLARGQRMLRADAGLRRLARARALWSASAGMAFPFVVPFAIKIIDMPIAAVGLLLAVKMLSYSITNPLWGHLSRILGNRWLMIFGILLQIAVPALTILSPWLPRSVLFSWLGISYDYRLLAIVLASVFIGTSQACLQVSINAFVMQILPARKAATFLGFFFLVTSPTMAMPVVGALAVGAADRFALGMSLAIVLGMAMLRDVLRLKEVQAEVSASGDAYRELS